VAQLGLLSHFPQNLILIDSRQGLALEFHNRDEPYHTLS